MHQFTFHYGSILMPNRKAAVIYFTIYIPLWFYSNQVSCQSIYCCCEIYIPLWFYSNADLPQLGTSGDIIYIPLWFYSNKADASAFLREFSIYIPLWFYSNFYPDNKVTLLPEFTFHYGSILIVIALLKVIIS